jgi:hypothetical protein
MSKDSMSNDSMSNEDKPTWLRQNLLAIITTYNKSMQARNALTHSNANGPEKRREVIKSALESLLPENFQSTDGKPIEEASITGTTSSALNVFGNKASGAYNTLSDKASGYKNSINNWYSNRNSPATSSGGRTKKGKKNRKNKNKKSRKSKY